MGKLDGDLKRFRRRAVRNTMIGYVDGFYFWNSEDDATRDRPTEFFKDFLFILSWSLTFASAIVSILEGLEDKPSDAIHITQGILLLLSILMDIGKVGTHARTLHVDRRTYLEKAEEGHVSVGMLPGDLGFLNAVMTTWPAAISVGTGATLAGVGFFADVGKKASTVLTTIAPIVSSFGETLTSERLEVESDILKEATANIPRAAAQGA